MASEPAFQESGRRVDRRGYSAEVQFRFGTRRATVRVRDLSKFGARIEGVFLVHEGDHFFIKLPGIESLEAKVIWVAEFEFGCEFLHPLNLVIFEALTRAN